MNKKKKIAIVGAGNAACATALRLYRICNISDPLKPIDKISIYHDPSVPTEIVGQGSTLQFVSDISDVLGINWYDRDNIIKATYKSGILYEGWGKKTEKTFHPFNLGSTAIHFVPHLLSKAILESGLFDVIEKNITDTETEIDADFVFDCRGKNNRDKGLYDKLTNPLNHVILAKTEGRDFNLNYTRCVATPDGWTFVIPNHSTVSYGYLFNSNITDISSATKTFIKMFGVEPNKNFPFENYIAKDCTHGKKTILNGNRLSFLEPLEATSIGYYGTVVDKFLRHFIFNANCDRHSFNTDVRDEMYKIQNFILWHYQYGSKYDSPFWDYSKQLPFNPGPIFENYLKFVRNNSISTCRHSRSDSRSDSYSQWTHYSFKVWSDANDVEI
jgi:hypothetical protein